MRSAVVDGPPPRDEPADRPRRSSHSTGAGAIIIRAVALTAPTVTTTSAHEGGVAPLRAGSRPPTVRPTIQPSPAHGSSIADVRDTYGRRYGVSW